jgi:hypothetical protein
LKTDDLDALLRAHPIEDTWSALEYACHVRDVLDVQLGRLTSAMTEELFTPAPMRRDERVSELRYNAQVPTEVADAIDANADALAALLEGFSDEEWSRSMSYSYPVLAVRPLSWVAQHTVHELEHHLLDIGRVLRAARGR